MNSWVTSELREHYKKGTPFLFQPDPKQTTPFTSLPFLQSLQSLLHTWSGSIQVHLPDLRDEISSMDSTSSDALRYFNQGMGLLFKEAQFLSPLLNEQLILIRNAFNLSALTTARCLIYATPDGKGTGWHFDQNINLVLQIQGTKKWTMSKNTSVLNPLTRHTMGQSTDPELSTYLDSDLPIAMSSETEGFNLTPGSLLFVPRGYWHSTEAAGDALALNFTFTAPAWLDLLTAALRSRLALSPEWRETAHVDTPERFEELLLELVHDLPNWDAREILSVTESKP